MGLFGQSEPAGVQIRGKALTCQVCGQSAFYKKEGQLHSGIATFFQVEWASPTAHCYICAGCGYIHWFLPQ